MGTHTIEHWEYSEENPQGVKVGETTVETTPIIMSKTTFNKYVANVLGSGDFMAGADAFQALLATCKAKTDRVGFCYTQYTAASTFEKSEVQLFTDAMVAADPQIMTEQQQTAILGNWPEV